MSPTSRKNKKKLGKSPKKTNGITDFTESTVRNWIPDINEEDFVFLENEVSKLFKEYVNDCIDNFRISRANSYRENFDEDSADISIEYKQAHENGCCGFSDDLYTNPITGNRFYIGCNYGH